MNGSFDPYRLVNTYGAFGTVEEEREELIIESAHDIQGPWKEYQFKVKPGDVSKGQRWISPYHYRLDWQMWIASCCGRIESSPWMFNFLLKLLKEDPKTLSLMKGNPWDVDGEGKEERVKPKYIRVDRYKYKYGERGDSYWIRTKSGRFFPKLGVCNVELLEEFVSSTKTVSY